MSPREAPATLADLPGGSGHEHSSWLVGPCGQHRDSDVTERCNFDVALASLDEADPEGHDHEVHRFGHFAVGWVEEVACRPGSRAAAVAAELRARLADHPVLDEDSLSMMEGDEAAEAWESWQRREMVRGVAGIIAAEHGADPDDVVDAIERLNSDTLWSIFADVTGPEIGHEGGCSYRASRRDLERVAEQVVDLVDFPAGDGEESDDVEDAGQVTP